jgi:hypothetical protein
MRKVRHIMPKSWARTAAWIGTALTLIALSVWFCSRWWQASWFVRGPWDVGLVAGNGDLAVFWSMESQPSVLPVEIQVRRVPDQPGWNWYCWLYHQRVSREHELCIPLWYLVAITAMPSVALWRRSGRRRANVGHCSHCGYSLVGLVGDRCPECGALQHSLAATHPSMNQGGGLVPSSR